MIDKNKELETCKQKYELPHMSQEQLKAMKMRMEEADMKNNRDNIKQRWIKITAAAAAVAATFVILPNTSGSVAYAMKQIPVIGGLVEVVTFRDYLYEDERNYANIEIPEIVPQPVSDKTGKNESQYPSQVQESLKRTTDEINAEIKEISEKFLDEFEENLKNEEGYQNMVVKSEIISTTQEYFTLKLICYQAAGSGAEWNYYYTMDLNTGERMRLSDLFNENTDYITPISENIKEQMKKQMEEDENKQYWLEQEVEEWNFKEINEETEFYINEQGTLVISFNEGDVAPMYMGVVTFEIPGAVISDLLK